MNRPLCYIDNSDQTKPEINLALEEFAVRNLDPSKDYLLVYRNDSSVIMGKHQNPFQEANNWFTSKENHPIFRRISGGGTVYHDRGNINFTYITSQSAQDFNKYFRFLKPIVEYLRSYSIDACINQRNDIVVGEKKVSGNAQFSSRGILLSHGTLLYNTNLEILRKALNNSNYHKYSSKATASKRSSVENLNTMIHKAPDTESFAKGLIDVILTSAAETDKIGLNASQWDEIHALAEKKYSSWDWRFGRTPKFSFKDTLELRINHVYLEFVVEHGYIAQVSASSPSDTLVKVFTDLNGKKYMPDIFKQHLEKENFVSEYEIEELLKSIF